MRKLTRLLGSLHKREEGITGLETAIILIAFVIVASVFAFVVLSTGLFSAERGKETVFAGLEKARGNLEARGALTASAPPPRGARLSRGRSAPKAVPAGGRGSGRSTGPGRACGPERRRRPGIKP